MKKTNVIFRADGNTRMGLGHLVRSAALAEMLAAEFHCVLLYRDCPEGLLPDLAKAYREVKRIGAPAGDQEDARELVAYAAGTAGADRPIVVLDGYHFKTDYQSIVVDAGCRLVCIDDIHHCRFLADLIINHAPAATVAQYDALPHTAFALGLRFALLRKPFREAATQKEHQEDGGNNVFVCLGGADPDNVTLEVLQQLTRHGDPHCTVSLVVGSAYAYHRELAAYLKNTDLQVQVYSGLGPQEMAELMTRSAAGITSPSTVSLEYLSTGGQLFLLQIADNQSEVYAALLERGLARDVSEFAPARLSGEISASPVLDGQQDVRFRSLFRALGIRYRLATPADSGLYYEWANDPLVRAQSFASRSIPRSEHEKWYAQKLADNNSILLVFELDEQPIGQVRLGISGTTATIGYSVAETARGRGLGLAMLHLAENYVRRNRPGVVIVAGYVKRDNIASLITFRRLGYQELATEDYPDAVKFELHGI